MVSDNYPTHQERSVRDNSINQTERPNQTKVFRWQPLTAEKIDIVKQRVRQKTDSTLPIVMRVKQKARRAKERVRERRRAFNLKERQLVLKLAMTMHEMGMRVSDQADWAKELVGAAKTIQRSYRRHLAKRDQAAMHAMIDRSLDNPFLADANWQGGFQVTYDKWAPDPSMRDIKRSQSSLLRRFESMSQSSDDGDIDGDSGSDSMSDTSGDSGVEINLEEATSESPSQEGLASGTVKQNHQTPSSLPVSQRVTIKVHKSIVRAYQMAGILSRLGKIAKEPRRAAGPSNTALRAAARKDVEDKQMTIGPDWQEAHSSGSPKPKGQAFQSVDLPLPPVEQSRPTPISSALVATSRMPDELSAGPGSAMSLATQHQLLSSARSSRSTCPQTKDKKDSDALLNKSRPFIKDSPTALKTMVGITPTKPETRDGTISLSLLDTAVPDVSRPFKTFTGSAALRQHGVSIRKTARDAALASQLLNEFGRNDGPGELCDLPLGMDSDIASMQSAQVDRHAKSVEAAEGANNDRNGTNSEHFKGPETSATRSAPQWTDPFLATSSAAMVLPEPEPARFKKGQQAGGIMGPPSVLAGRGDLRRRSTSSLGPPMFSPMGCRASDHPGAPRPFGRKIQQRPAATLGSLATRTQGRSRPSSRRPEDNLCMQNGLAISSHLDIQECDAGLVDYAQSIPAHKLSELCKAGSSRYAQQQCLSQSADRSISSSIGLQQAKSGETHRRLMTPQSHRTSESSDRGFKSSPNKVMRIPGSAGGVRGLSHTVPSRPSKGQTFDIAKHEQESMQRRALTPGLEKLPMITMAASGLPDNKVWAPGTSNSLYAEVEELLAFVSNMRTRRMSLP